MNKHFRFLIIIVFLIWAPLTVCDAQTLTVTIRDSEKSSLPGASVQLTRVPDSSITYAATDKSGIARFESIMDGLYLLKMSYLGYQTLEKSINVKSDQRSFEFQLKKDAIALGEVSVTAQRPLIRQEDDKMIIDPLPLANSSTNTLEVLEKTPGLFVDQDGGIYLSSTSPAAVYINGREQKMSTQDVATLLRALPPGSVDRIEVMRTPSTKYDAASSGGIINVILKKGVKLGRFGTISAGMSQGFYGNQFAGFSLNNSGAKSTTYMNVNYSHNDMVEDLNASRSLRPDTSLFQSSRSRQMSHQGYLGYGWNYEAGKKTTLSYDGRISANFPSSSAQSNSTIKTLEEMILSDADNHIDNKSTFISIQQDFGVVRKFDTLGSELDTKLTYSYNSNNAEQHYSSDYYSPMVINILGDGDNLQQRHFILFQSDLTWYFPRKIKMESGIKSTYQDYGSNAEYTVDYGSGQIDDPQRTNAFIYQENINAGYIQASKSFGRFLLKTGVRMEHTYMSGHQTVPSDTSFVVNRADWFPYVYLSRPILKIMGIQLQAYMIYRRTISRPDYQNLNPYIKYIDPFLCEAGNPALKPQFTHNIELNVSFDDTPIFAIGQNYTTDLFTSVVYQDSDQPTLAIRTFDNMGKNRETYIRVMAGIPPGKRYFFALGGQYNYNEYDGFYDNEPFKFQRGSWRFFTYQSLNIFKDTRLTMFGFLMVKGQQGFYELGTFGQLNFGLTQNLFDKKLSITVNMRDVLHTMVTSFTLNQGSISTIGDRYSDNQRFGINLRYNFGMKSKQDRRNPMQFEPEE